MTRDREQIAREIAWAEEMGRKMVEENGGQPLKEDWSRFVWGPDDEINVEVIEEAPDELEPQAAE